MDLKKKVGPLPVWGWGAAGVGGALAFILWRKHKAASASSSASSTTTPTTSSTTAVPAGSSGSGGSSGYAYSGGAGYPLQYTPSPTAANTGQATNPYMLVADIADEGIATAAGIPKSWLAYVGQDPNAAQASPSNGYGPPTDLPLASSLPPGAIEAYGGLAQRLAPPGAPTVYGATRVGTPQAFAEWYQAVMSGQSGAQGYYVAQ